MNPDFKLDPPPQSLQSPLLELRDYYKALVEEYEQKAVQAKEKLAHIEALLAVWAIPNTGDESETALVMSADHSFETSEPDLDENNSKVFIALKPRTTTPGHEQELTHSLNGNVPPKAPEPPIQESPQEDIEPYSVDVSPQLTLLPNNHPNDHRIVANNSIEESALQEVNSQTTSSNHNNILMLPPYQALNRFEAIKKVLSDHKGAILHIDFIVRELYGELKPENLRLVKSPIGTALSHGKIKKIWESVPDSKGCYTLDLNLIQPNEPEKVEFVAQDDCQTSTQPNSDNLDNTLTSPPSETMSVMQAISKFLQDNKGKVLQIDDIVKAIYGDLSGQLAKKARRAVTNRLSKGKLEGRWDSIPMKPGYYTWNLRLMSP